MASPVFVPSQRKGEYVQKSLAGYDGSKGGKLALQCAAMMAREFGAPVTALWAREPLPRHSDLPGEYEEEAEAAEEYFNARREEKKVVAAQHGLDGRCETRRGHPAKAIIEFADEGGFDLIVVGQ